MKLSPTIRTFIIIAVTISVVAAIIWLWWKKRKDKNQTTDDNKTETTGGNVKILHGGKNNPGHLRYSKKNDWVGKIYPEKGTTFEFESFDTLENGVRAWLINARTQLKNGYNTVDKFIDRLTPASENPEKARQNMKNEIRKVLGKEIIDVSDLWKIAPIVFKYEGNPDWKLYGQNVHIYRIAKENNIV